MWRILSCIQISSLLIQSLIQIQKVQTNRRPARAAPPRRIPHPASIPRSPETPPPPSHLFQSSPWPGPNSRLTPPPLSPSASALTLSEMPPAPSPHFRPPPLSAPSPPSPRRLHIRHVVQRRQRVHRRIRPQRLHLAHLPLRRIKKHRRPDDPPPKRVEAPPIKLPPRNPACTSFSQTTSPPKSPPVDNGSPTPHPSPGSPIPTPPTPGPGSSTTASENAPRAPDTGSPDRSQRPPATNRRTPPVGLARHDLPQQPLHIPPAFHELHRQPIQQFPLHRLFPLHPKILRRLHQPDPENICQIRFTVTRAVSGFSRETSHRAKSNRSAFASFGTSASPAKTRAPPMHLRPRLL